MSKDIAKVELIKLAPEVLQPKHIGDCFVGQVGVVDPKSWTQRKPI